MWTQKAIEQTAKLINLSEGFWACGIVKETLPLWKDENNYKLLTEDSQMIADHYLEEARK